MKTSQIINMQKINVCGIGPGHPDYILPEVVRLVQNSNLIVGAERHLEIFDLEGKERLELKNNLAEVIDILKVKKASTITVLVSGDTGFHSFLGTMLKSFSADELYVVPGISSYQYFFAKLGMSYEDAWIGSLHGMQANFIEQVKTHPKTFLLTDGVNSWKTIAKYLVNNHLGECTLHIGNRLSYADETIISAKAIDLQIYTNEFNLCAVIIINDKAIKR